MNNVETEGRRDVRGERDGERSGGSGPADSEGDKERDTISDSSVQDNLSRTTTERDTSRVPTGLFEIFRCDERRGVKRPHESSSRSNANSEDMERQYYQGFKERADRVFEEFQKSDGRFIRDIFRPINNEEFETIINCVRLDQHYQRGLLQICREKSHLHIAHDCAYSNSSCK